MGIRERKIYKFFKKFRHKNFQFYVNLKLKEWNFFKVNRLEEFEKGLWAEMACYTKYFRVNITPMIYTSFDAELAEFQKKLFFGDGGPT